MSNSKNSAEKTHHRAYANPTEDQAVANVMREEARKKRLECLQKEKARRNSDHIHRPGGVWHAEK